MKAKPGPTGKPASSVSILSLLALSALGGGSALASEPAFITLSDGLTLTRELRSPLTDGTEVVARRTYSIAILPDGDGWRVEGQLISAEVDAPPSLRPLAEVERTRPDSGLFPMYLDASGRLRPAHTSGTTAGPGAVRAALVSGGLAQTDRRTRQAAAPLVGQVGAMPLRSPVPEALFALDLADGTSSRHMTLPDQGEVTIEMCEHGADGQGQLRRIDRVVTTRVGQSTRRVQEQWLLRRR